MAYNEVLANRVRSMLLGRPDIDGKVMFGGLSFLRHGKMLCGVLKDDLVVRVDPIEAPQLLARSGVRPMDFTVRAMKGFVYVSSAGYATDDDLREWVLRGIAYISSLPQATK